MSQHPRKSIAAIRRPHIQGVMLYCDGDRNRKKGLEFKPVSISSLNRVFSTPVCEISELVGIPIQIMQVPTSAKLNQANQNATNLKVQCKFLEGSSDNHVGFAPDE